MIGWGLIGCGWLARDYTAPAIHGSARGRLVAAFDRDADSAEAVGAEDVCLSLDGLLGHDEVEAVYIATPNHLHAEQTIAALRAGKHVLCEKPTAMNAGEAEAMRDAAAEADRLLATAYDQRFHAAHLALRDLIAAGKLGTVTAVRIRYACWTGADWNPHPDRPHDNWRVDPERAGGGAMIDLAPHGLDLTQTLLGDQITDVHCLLQRTVHTDTPVDDGGAIVARTAGGVLLSQSVAYNCPETFARRRLEVIGTKAMAVALDTMGQTPGGSLTLTDAATGADHPIDFSATDRSPFLNQIDAFNDALLGRSPWPHPFERDVHTMRLLDRCREEA